MKKILFSLIMLTFLSFPAFASGQRYIVFFAETSEIPEEVIEKIIFSKRFCLTVPASGDTPVPENLEELVSYGKVEPSLRFEPEPVLPILASVYSASGKKADRQRGFGDYVNSNLNSFQTKNNREKFGIFLKSGEVSHNILYYFANLELSWINFDNSEEKIYGAYLIDGVTSFSLYKNFPAKQKDVMKWLESKKENVIPVLLTKRHLNNKEFMGYLIDLFDRSKYIKPAIPLYISLIEKDMVSEKKEITFEQVPVKSSVMTKLYSAANCINEYNDSSNFSEHFYSNARSELVFLTSHDLLKGVASNKVDSTRMFDAAYNNIFRLTGSEAPTEKELTRSGLKGNHYAGTEEVFQTTVSQIPNGISVKNDGIINGLNLTSRENDIRISVSFESGQWNETIEFIDIYIDLNNLDGAGSTQMLSDVNGYLTPDSAWEYAVRVNSEKAVVYRYSGEGEVMLTEIPVSGTSVSVPKKFIRGNPSNWGVQAVGVSVVEGKNSIIDFFNQSSQPKNFFLTQRPFQIPAARLKK